MRRKLEELSPGDFAKGFALLSTFELRSSNGRQRASGRLTDASGGIDFVCWSPSIFEDIVQGDVVAYSGSVGTFRDDLQLEIERVRLARESDRERGLCEGDLIPSAPVPPEEILRELDALMKELLTPEGLRLYERFVELHGEAFKRHPAGKSVHHAFRGGLLLHTTSLAVLAASLVPHYGAQGKGLDPDVLLLGALLHDAGKMAEIGSLPGSPWTEAGNLIGHVAVGCRIWHRLCDDVGAAGQLRTAVEHLILSHHGEQEKGAAVEPKTPEALAFSALDRLDASLWALWGAASNSRGDVVKCWALGGEVVPRITSGDYLEDLSTPGGLVLRGTEPKPESTTGGGNGNYSDTGAEFEGDSHQDTQEVLSERIDAVQPVHS